MRLTPEREQDIRVHITAHGIRQYPFNVFQELLAEIDALRTELAMIAGERHSELISNTKSFYRGTYFLKQNNELRQRIEKLREALEILRKNSASIWEGRISGEAVAQDDEMEKQAPMEDI